MTEGLNSPSIIEKAKENKISKLELSPKDKKFLFFRVMNDFTDISLNNDKLGEYTNKKLPTIEVINRLKFLGLLDDVKDFYNSLTFKSEDPLEQGEDFEKLARIVLKEVESNIEE